MAYQNKVPPIRLKVTIDTFNSLIEFISKIESTSLIEKEKVTKLKEKLLRYSIPITNENEENLVEMRFYPNEAGKMIDILLYAVDGTITTNNYYAVLLEVRNRIKEERSKNE